MKYKDSTFNKFKKVLIGGTFDALHKGHQDYIKFAFDLADEVCIFISSDKMALILKPYGVLSYNSRKEKVIKFINDYLHRKLREIILKLILKIRKRKRLEIKQLNSENELEKYCLENEISLVIVSPEYYELFKKINEERTNHGLEWFYILVKERVKDENQNYYSSRSQKIFTNSF